MDFKGNFKEMWQESIQRLINGVNETERLTKEEYSLQIKKDNKFSERKELIKKIKMCEDFKTKLRNTPTPIPDEFDYITIAEKGFDYYFKYTGVI